MKRWEVEEDVFGEIFFIRLFIYSLDYIMGIILERESALTILWFTGTCQPSDREQKPSEQNSMWLPKKVDLTASEDGIVQCLVCQGEGYEIVNLSTSNCQEQQVFSSSMCPVHQILCIAGIITPFSLWTLGKEKKVCLVHVIGQFYTMLGINAKRNLCTLISFGIT